MPRCATRHPEHPDLACLLPRTDRGHPEHLAMRYLPDRSEPERLRWPDPDYRSLDQIREQARAAGVTIEEHAQTVRAQIAAASPQIPLKLTPGQRKKSRLGQVANLLINNVGVWIDGHRMETREIGGSSGLRRLRELRDDYRWHIEQRPTATSTDQYRLVELPWEFRGQ